MGRARLLAALAALQLASCTLLFDEPKYLLVGGRGVGGGDGGDGGSGGEAGVCDGPCGGPPVAVFFVDDWDPEATTNAKFAVLEVKGWRLDLSSSAQVCRIGWDKEQVFIGCPLDGAHYLLLKLESQTAFYAYQLEASSGFTRDCAGFDDCTGSLADNGTGLLDGVTMGWSDGHLVVSIPESNVGDSFSMALEIGLTAGAPNPAFFPNAATGAEAETQPCTRPESCQ